MGRVEGPDWAAARSLVASRGAIVFQTGPTTYDRFVRDASFCSSTYTAETAVVATADVARCLVGGVCREPDMDNGR